MSFKYKVYGTLFATIFSSQALAVLTVDASTQKVVATPHNYEYEYSENPEEYWWCGQTAFENAIGSRWINKTLPEIHEMFKKSDKNLGIYYKDNCSGKWCSSPILMEKAVQQLQNEGYNISIQRK
ncbi:MAG: hypothetical protein GY828_00360, partial [Candidatus Gracilibacteria bacterium]|nr:hypothetical protein [Candidatus Gracilibacteria bacterium]